MPCYDSRNEPDYVRAEAKKEFQADLDKLTRMLCWLCSMNPNPHLIANHSAPEAVELREWWEEHKKLDAKRKRGK